jgi:tetratricopeptide (TPR) repeat protein
MTHVLATILAASLPPEHKGSAGQLAEVIALAGIDQAAATQRLVELTLRAAILSLAGCDIVAGGTGVDFSGATLSNIVIRDIVGGNKIELHLPPAPRPPFWNVPYPPLGERFVGRDDELQALEALLTSMDVTAAIVPTVSGTGGIGKTQLASEFAHRCRDRYPGGVFWVSMAEPAAVAGQIAGFGAPDALDLPGWSGLEFDQKCQAVLRAWAAPTARLLIFDNLEDAALLKQWRPKGGGSRVLVTTRRGSWTSAGVQVLKVRPLQRAASYQLLLTPRAMEMRCGVEQLLASEHTREGADTICDLVGDLPLALSLAAVYLHINTSVTIASYAARLTQSLADDPTLNELPEEGLPNDYPRGLTATLRLSYDQLDKHQDRLALAVLHSAAQFGFGPIPQTLLVQAVELDPEDADTTSDTYDQALRRLINVGLVDKEGETIVLHTLIRTVVGGWDTEVAHRREAIAKLLITELHAINNAGYAAHGQWYITALIAAANVTWAHEREDILLGALGTLVQKQGDLLAARPYLDRSLAISMRVRGLDDRNTIAGLNNIGQLLYAQGDLSSARRYYEQALATSQKVLGEFDLQTASLQENLGLLLQAQGDRTGARRFLERSLITRIKVQGEYHSDTAMSLNNYGHLLRVAGEFKDAQDCYERALAINERVYGENHPATAQSLNNLGYLFRTRRQWSTAETYYRRALTIRLHLLGETHPDTASSLSNLGALLQARGDLVEAETYCRRALAIREQVLGDHSDTAASLNNLGTLCAARGDVAEACQCYERAIAIYDTLYDGRHPIMAKSLSNLSSVLQDMGDLTNAYTQSTRALAIAEAMLGPDHPETQVIRRNLALLNAEIRSRGRL